MTGEADAPRLILVGRVAGPFGIRGELRLTAYTEDPLALLAYRDLQREDGSPALTLSGGRVAKANELVVRAVQSPDRDAAEALKGLQLFVPRAALPAPDEDEFYLADLIGLTAETSDGTPLGRIKAVLNHGAGDILEVEASEPGRPTRLFPFTREVVPEVSVADGRVVILPPVETGDPEPANADEG